MADEEDKVIVEDSKKSDSKKKAAPAKAASVKVEPAKSYSFAQWAARRGVPAHHRGGRRAFVNNVNKHRTLEEWDKCFEGY